MTLAYIILFSLLGSVGALVGAGLLLAFPRLHRRLRTPLLAYAVGTLLGATFLALLPEAIASGGLQPILNTVLVGFLAFFLVEKLLRLRHAHAHAGEPGHAPAGAFVLVGDAFHNFVDGVLIASAFLISVPLGVLAAFAAVAHEVPQELGDFVVLLQSGFARWRAFWLNFAISLFTLPGALLTYFMRDALMPVIPYFLAIASASFLYIAATDLAPILHHEVARRQSAMQLASLLMGVVTLFVLHTWLG